MGILSVTGVIVGIGVIARRTSGWVESRRTVCPAGGHGAIDDDDDDLAGEGVFGIAETALSELSAEYE